MAARLGVSADTIRYYERRGLFPKAARNSSGYRLYSEASLARIQFVRNALRFGFSLKQIANFLGSRASGHPPCHDVRSAGQRILAEMDRQIEELTVARAEIRKTLIEWDQKLAHTPTGAPAHLLDTLTPASPAAPKAKLRRL